MYKKFVVYTYLVNMLVLEYAIKQNDNITLDNIKQEKRMTSLKCHRVFLNNIMF